MGDKKIVFYDDNCGFCNKFILYIISKDAKDIFRFTPQTNIKYYLNQEDVTHTDSIILKDDEELLLYSDAIIAILEENKATKLWSFLIKLFPRFIRDRVYKVIALIRRKIPVKNNSCPIPNQEIRRKFI